MSKQTKDLITAEPKLMEILNYDKIAVYKEFSTILEGMQDSYLSAKDIHQLYYDKKTNSHQRGLKTIYRYIEKLTEEGLIQEAGQRMTAGSRSTEAIYCRTAKLFFYEGEEVIDQWKTAKSKELIKLVHSLVTNYLDSSLEYAEFEKIFLQHFVDQDRISSEMLRIMQRDDQLMNNLAELPPQKISKLLFMATDFAIKLQNDNT